MVRKVSPNGWVHGFFGSGYAGFSPDDVIPYGLAVDDRGSVYAVARRLVRSGGRAQSDRPGRLADPKG